MNEGFAIWVERRGWDGRIIGRIIGDFRFASVPWDYYEPLSVSEYCSFDETLIKFRRGWDLNPSRHRDDKLAVSFQRFLLKLFLKA